MKIYSPNITGSILISGSLEAFSLTGSLLGTASNITPNINQNLYITGSLTLSGSSGLELNIMGDAIITGSLTLSGSSAVELNIIGDTVITGSVIVSGSRGAGVFSKGGTIADLTNGVSISGSYIVWRSPFSCSVVSLYGRRSEGGNAEVNARRSGSAGYSLHTGSNLILGTNNTWLQSLSVTNILYAPGDSLEIIISGSANTQVDYIKV